MSKRIANSKSATKARNGRVRYSRWTQAKRDALQDRLEKVNEMTKQLGNLPKPTRWTQFKNRVTRIFRRGIQ